MSGTKEFEILTPRMPNGSRIEIQVSLVDASKIERGRRWSASVTDIRTGQVYALRDRACSIPGCRCDAEVVP